MRTHRLAKDHRLCSLGVATLFALGVASVPQSAQAIPLIGIGAQGGAYLGVLTGARQGNAGFELEGAGQAFGFDVAGNMLGQLTGAPGNLLEVGVRQELSFIPMVSVKPMIGYQGQNFFTPSGSWDNAPLARLDLAFSPILSPIWFDGNVGVSEPLSTLRPIGEYMVGGYFSFLPIASVGLRYRGYRELQGGTRDFNAVELGLRVSI